MSIAMMETQGGIHLQQTENMLSQKVRINCLFDLVGGTIAHTSPQLSHKNRRLVLSYLDTTNIWNRACSLHSLSLLPWCRCHVPVSPEDSSGTRLEPQHQQNIDSCWNWFCWCCWDDGAAPSAVSLEAHLQERRQQPELRVEKKKMGEAVWCECLIMKNIWRLLQLSLSPQTCE